MFCGKQANALLNKTHKKSLHAILNGYEISLEDTLDSTGYRYIHHKDLQQLMTEVYKSQNSLSPGFMTDIFVEKDTPYNFRAGRTMMITKVSKNIGTNSIVFRVAQAWNKLPKALKECKSLNAFKKGI